MAGHVLGVPLNEICNRHLALEDLWCSSARSLHEHLLNASNPRAAIWCLAQALETGVHVRRARHPAISFALREFAHRPQLARVADVSRATRYSPKGFIRLFTAAVGLTPKRYCRILRLQAVTRSLAVGQPVDWSRFALDAGYFDQSHLIRDFRAMTGLAPAQYRPMSPTALNHVRVSDL